MLEREAEKWLRQSDRLVLDLAQVRHLDVAGAVLLQRYGSRLQLRGASPFLSELLEKYALPPDQ